MLRGCRRSLSTRLPVLREPADVLARWRAAVPARTAADVLSYYSSDLGGIVTDPSLMLLPVDDHGFHRGHAVFDTCNVADGRAFGLTMHLDRLLGSAKQARILDEGGASEEYRESLRSIVLQAIAASGRRDEVFVRYWLTAGRGDFSIAPTHCVGPSFYCVVHEDTHSAAEPRGVAACVVPTPLKPPFLATMKTTNYLLNAHVAMDAHAKDCQLGVQLEADGTLAESAVSTIAIIDAHGVLRSPPAERILASTTWKRVLELAAPLVGAGASGGGGGDAPLLTGVDAMSPVTEAQLRGAREVLSLGGGWLTPVVRLDGLPVGDGEPGPVFRALDPAVRAEFVNVALSDLVPY